MVDLKSVFDFLRELGKNNNKAWFEANRARYEDARAGFEEYVAALMAGMHSFLDLEGIAPKDCILRIYRDVRFSKDKSPYKTNFSAAIAPGGRKSGSVPYFLHLQPGDHSMLAGGCHESTPEQVARWREMLDRNPAPLLKIIGSAEFKKTFGSLWGEKLARPPKGYPPDHPQIELLKMKSFAAVHNAADRDVLGPGFVQESVKVFKAMKPFLEHLSAIL
jgi:uncharacterized protein (TIGR02453 family)